MIQFDLRNRLEFNIDGIYAHRKCEDYLESTKEEENYEHPDLVSCSIPIESLPNGCYECEVRGLSATVFVWESVGKKGLICLQDDLEGINEAIERFLAKKETV